MEYFRDEKGFIVLSDYVEKMKTFYLDGEKSILRILDEVESTIKDKIPLMLRKKYLIDLKILMLK